MGGTAFVNGFDGNLCSPGMTTPLQFCFAPKKLPCLQTKVVILVIPATTKVVIKTFVIGIPLSERSLIIITVFKGGLTLGLCIRQPKIA